MIAPRLYHLLTIYLNWQHVTSELILGYRSDPIFFFFFCFLLSCQNEVCLLLHQNSLVGVAWSSALSAWKQQKAIDREEIFSFQYTQMNPNLSFSIPGTNVRDKIVNCTLHFGLHGIGKPQNLNHAMSRLCMLKDRKVPLSLQNSYSLYLKHINKIKCSIKIHNH